MGETFGCAAISEYSEKYQRDINEAIKVAIELKVPAIHVMSGICLLYTSPSPRDRG